MSSALAIASVTQILKDLLNNGLIDHDVIGQMGVSVVVTALPPDRVNTETEASQLNLFMFQATPNQGWRNHALPSHNAKGDRITNPPLALDLHYLLTAYGAEELHHDILLGYGMQLLHENPVLVREAIRTSLALPTNIAPGKLPLNLLALATSELADQIEQIKITPELLNPEEMSRLWTAFGAKYRPTAVYKATVVLIESRKPTRQALPVRERKIYVVPFHQPVIEKISAKSGPGAPVVENQKILPGYTLVISGIQLKGEVVSVSIDDMEITPATADITDFQISFPLPADLSAGIHGLQVVHKILMGSPPLPHKGVISNVQPFVLSPAIQTITVSHQQVAAGGLWSATVGLAVKPAINVRQQVVVLLNEWQPDPLKIPLSYSFEATGMTLLSPPDPTEHISIQVKGVKAASYLVRLRVDGAESLLQADSGFQYNAPKLDIP